MDIVTPESDGGVQMSQYQCSFYSLRPRQVDFDATWKSIENSIKRIMKLQPLERRVWDYNFYDIYSLCVAIPEPLSERLYGKTKECLEGHVTELYQEINAANDSELLSIYCQLWNVYYKGALCVHNLFGYLNKQYIKIKRCTEIEGGYGAYSQFLTQKDVKEIGLLAMEIWRKNLIDPMEKRLVGHVLSAIAADREGKNSVPVIIRIEEENERSIRFLHKSSHEKVTKLCQDVMVDAHKERLYAVCHEYIEGECMSDLHNMYRILKPINGGLSVVIREFQNFVKKTGLEALRGMRGDNIPQQFVENVLQVYNRFSAMVTKVYYDDGDFVGALDKALQSVVNYREDPRQAPKASERLARYTDTLLRKSGKGLSDSELDTKLSQAIIIFRYIEDKDIFQKFYSKMLANRLITNGSLSKDAEESMISKLKQACGFEFTSKLSRMFTDVGLSHELTDKFISHCAVSNVTLNVQMTVLILQAGAWPLSAPSSTPTSDGKDSASSIQVTGFIVPAILLPSIEHFEKYYQASHNGRKLTWLFNLASVEVKLHYLDKAYQVTMSAHQLAILLCFETKDSVPLRCIEKETGLSDDLLSRNARALVDSGILLMTKQMNEENEIALNLTLTSKRLRFKVLVPQLQRHVIEQTKSRFTPDVNFIKKNIESLIEKLYIQRTDQNDEYQYLA
uniref:Cullin family profile domain-containing protein n=1 Tax=Setaria digitata TaxID=48799 RepID=A0A915Q330_9BILA